MPGLITPSLRQATLTERFVPVIIELSPSTRETVLPQILAKYQPLWDIRIRQLNFIAIERFDAADLEPFVNLPGVESITLDKEVTFFFHFGLINALQEGIRPRDFLLGKEIRLASILTSSERGKTEGVFGTKAVWELMGGPEAEEDEVDGSNTKVCVIDTGVWKNHVAFLRDVFTMSISPFGIDKIVDSSGHGTWCVAAVGGRETASPQGYVCRGMSNAQLGSVKALRTPFGISRTSDVLRAIEVARKEFNPKIYSMSLGSAASDPAELDPLCKVITNLTKEEDAIFVVAAGNSGPDPGTIDSPGICPEAITVGSVSIMDEGQASFFSGRGPSVDQLTKPDIMFWGGGRINKDDKPMEKLMNPTGYLSSSDLSDRMLGVRPRLAYGSLMGTSMATPGVAGVLALWNDIFLREAGRGIKRSDIDIIFTASGGQKNNTSGFGTIKYNWIKGQVPEPPVEPEVEPPTPTEAEEQEPPPEAVTPGVSPDILDGMEII